VRTQGKKPQVPPLRSFGAPVGLTILLSAQQLKRETLGPAKNCHPDRSSEGA